jgi:hypothetical protein
MIKIVRRVLCVVALLVLAALGLLACTQQQAKDEGKAVKSCAESQVFIDCEVAAYHACKVTPCTPEQVVATAVECLKVCDLSVDAMTGAGVGGAAGSGGSNAR